MLRGFSLTLVGSASYAAFLVRTLRWVALFLVACGPGSRHGGGADGSGAGSDSGARPALAMTEAPSWQQLNTFRTNAQINGAGVCTPVIL